MSSRARKEGEANGLTEIRRKNVLVNSKRYQKREGVATTTGMRALEAIRLICPSVYRSKKKEGEKVERS